MSNVRKILTIIIGTGILSFGLQNIHQQAAITEGGVLGGILLLNHWFGLSTAIATPILDFICYLFAFRFLGKEFLKMTLISTISLSGFFFLWEQFPPMLPDLSAYPLAAAVLGGLFVGVGVGLVVRQGGSTGGDDALALAISKVTSWKLSRTYLFTDLTVLALSLTYISVQRIAFSVITVFISSFVIDYMKEFPVRGQKCDSVFHKV